MSAHREMMLDGLCRLLRPRHVALIGARESTFAGLLLRAAMRHGATLHVIAEAPGQEFTTLRAEGGDTILLHDAPAHAALGLLPVPGLCWVDADPNWHTVGSVLDALESQARRLGADLPVVIVEGAGWPHGRRDGYDDPGRLPEAFRHPHERAGLLPGQAMPAGGAGLYAGDYHASADNEPLNGVLTAAEDFLEGRMGALRSVVLPGFGGLVAITPRAGPAAAAFAPEALAAYLQKIAEALESARLEQAVALATLRAELARAEVMIGLLRGAIARPATPPAAAAPLPETPAPVWRRAARKGLRVAGLRRGGVSEAAPSEEERALARLRASPAFDADWYLTQNPDVAAAGLDPAAHYLRSGAAELRDPGPFFSSSAYLREHADVADAGVNPLLHYLNSGAAEGRLPGGDAARLMREQANAIPAGANPLEHFIMSQTRQAGGGT